MNRVRPLFGATLAVAAFALALTGCASSTPETFAGTWGDEANTSAPSLTIQADGSFSGTDGCNRLKGTATIAGDTITFGGAASTRMMCQDVDTWLSNLETGTIADGALQISDKRGDVIGSLAKQ